jgi:hypothetical protein
MLAGNYDVAALLETGRASTQRLADASAKQRYEDLCVISNLLCQLEIVDPGHLFQRLSKASEIDLATPRVRDWLYSPLFRGWLHRFGTIDRWDGEDEPLRLLLAEAPNMCLDLLSPFNFEALFNVESGYLQTWDPLL